MKFFRLMLLCAAAICCCTGGAYAQDLMPVQNDKGKYGYMNADGSVAIKYKYNEAHPFVDGKAKVKKGDKWGYIDPNGKEVIAVRYSYMEDWRNGICRVAVGGKNEDGELVNAKWGYIDNTGKEVLPIVYDEIGQFSQNIAYIRKGKDYGYINLQAQVIVPCEFAAVGSPNKKGLFWVNKGGNFKDWESKDLSFRQNWGGKYGLYNVHGEELIPCEYKSLGIFMTDEMVRRQNLAIVENIAESKKAVVELVKKYTVATKLVDNDYRINLYSQLAAFEGFYAKNENYTRDRSTFVSLGHKNRVSGLTYTSEFSAANSLYYPFSTIPEFDDLLPNYYYWVSDNYDGSYAGIINVIEKKVMLEKGKYEMVGVPVNYISFVASNVGKNKMTMTYYSILNQKELLSEPVVFNAKNDEKFDNLLSIFCDDFAEVRRNGLSSLISISGFAATSTLFEKISDFYDGKAIVMSAGKYGMIKRDSYQWNLSVPLEYDVMLLPTDGVVGALKNGKSGFLTFDGEVVIPFKYDAVAQFLHGYARVCNNDQWGMIDLKGNQVVPMKWKRVLDADTTVLNYAWVQLPDDSYGCFDIKQQKLLGGGYKNIFSYFRDDKAAFVSKDSEVAVRNENGQLDSSVREAIGCVTPEGELLIPYVFLNLEEAKACYAEMKKQGKMKLTDSENRSLQIYSSGVRNSFQLFDLIPTEVWDF